MTQRVKTEKINALIFHISELADKVGYMKKHGLEDTRLFQGYKKLLEKYESKLNKLSR